MVEMAASQNEGSSRSSAATDAKAYSRILAVDYGRKRIGLALSDELCLIARPLATLVRVNCRKDLKRLREICREHQVKQVIVGQPLHMTGELSPLAEEAARFAARLGKEAGLPVELVDERLTTWEAKSIVSETGRGPRRGAAPIDDVAAAVFLREYLEGKRSQSHSVVGGGS
jgi:putative holliday junction resolvase